MAFTVPVVLRITNACLPDSYSACLRCFTPLHASSRNQRCLLMKQYLLLHNMRPQKCSFTQIRGSNFQKSLNLCGEFRMSKGGGKTFLDSFFPRNKQRMHFALKSLLQEAQNNLKIFKVNSLICLLDWFFFVMFNFLCLGF